MGSGCAETSGMTEVFRKTRQEVAALLMGNILFLPCACCVMCMMITTRWTLCEAHKHEPRASMLPPGGRVQQRNTPNICVSSEEKPDKKL